MAPKSPWLIAAFVFGSHACAPAGLYWKLTDSIRNGAPPQQRLVAHWRLNEKDGARVTDSSGNGNDAHLDGEQSWRPSSGRFSGALELGAGTHVVLNGSVPLAVDGRMTVAAWVNAADGVNGVASLVSHIGGVWDFRLDGDTGTVVFSCASGTASVSWAVEPGRWHHLAAVHTGARLLLYADGALMQREPAYGSVSDNTLDIRMGSEPDAGGAEHSAVLLDDVLIYDRALSAAEVAALAADRIAPAPDIENPAIDVVSISLRGVVSDRSGVASLTIAGEEVDVGPDGSWTIEIEITPPGQVVTATATDVSGNVSETDIRIDL